MIIAMYYLVSQFLILTADSFTICSLNCNHNPLLLHHRHHPFSASSSSTKLYSSSSPPSKQRRKKVEYKKYQYEVNFDHGKEDEHVHDNIIKKKDIGESTFWYSVQRTTTTNQNDVIPYQSTLDCNGPLPYGSYKQLGNEEYQSKPMCIVPIALDFWNQEGTRNSRRKYNSHDKNEIDTSSILSNVHQLIDAGFTSFQLYNQDDRNQNSNNKNYNSRSMTPSLKQTFTEQDIYNNIIRGTPSSVLNQCSFSTRIHIPTLQTKGTYQSNYKEDDDDSLFIFKEHLVRQHIGESIKNIYGHANACIDNIQVNYQYDEKYGMSPYTCDILSVLYDLQREGFIRSISGLNFPQIYVQEIESNGFHLDYNQISCNLLHSQKYTEAIKTGNHYCHGSGNKKIVLSSPLAGGLLNGQKRLSPDQYMSRSESWSYKYDLVNKWYPIHNKDENFKSHPLHLFNVKMMKVLEDIAYKHEVSISTVAFRWSIQLDHVGSVVIGSSLNTKYLDSDREFTRHADLRKLFTFYLDDEDMARLWEASIGYDFRKSCDDASSDFGEEEIDFGNKTLWL